MNLLTKLENFINSLLIMLGSWAYKTFQRIIPENVKLKYLQLVKVFCEFIAFTKTLPQKILIWLKNKIKRLKSKFAVPELKAQFTIFLNKIREEKKQSKVTHSKFQALKRIVAIPVRLVTNWVQGLSAIQSVMLLTLTAASFLAGVNIIFSGKRLIEHQSGFRAPASVEEEVPFDRPEYYKQQNRHLEITNVRLPVFFPEINQEKTIDIDFTVITKDRLTRKKLGKLEFQLRDHLILSIEPFEARFPLAEEGREILREKLLLEVNEFLHQREIDGSAIDIEITYILVN